MLRRKIGILSQDLKLLVDRSVNDNLKFILKSLGWRSIDVINDHILEVLDQVEIANKGCKMPNELSIGEQQQVAIARALLNSPEIILVDEPTGNLDEKAGEKIVRLLHNVKNKGTAVVMATHNYRLIKEFPAKIKKCENGFFFDYQF